MKIEKMTLQRWYGGSFRIPSITENRFKRFLVSSVGLVRSICKDRFDSEITVRFREGGSGAADQKRKIIWVNRDYLDGDFTFRADRPQIIKDGDTVLTVILGVIVHEIAHFAYSPATLKPFCDYVKKGTKRPYNEKIASVLGNIIEDIFIEAQLDRDVPSLNWMIQATRDVYYDEVDIQHRLDAVKELTSPPENFNDLVLALNLLILAKAREVVDVSPYLTEIFLKIKEAADLEVLEDRFKLSLELYDELLSKLDELPPCEEGENSEALKDALKSSNGCTIPHSIEGERSIEEAKGLEKITEELERLKSLSLRLVNPNQDDGSSSSLVTEEEVPMGVNPIEIDTRYEELATLARQKIAVNRPYGEKKVRGSYMKGLYRIGIDNRIFAEPIPVKVFKPVEAILLVDCSGSMHARDNLQKAWSAAYGAAFALTEARCSVSIYGHTADLIETGAVNLYKVKTATEPIDLVPYRASHLIKKGKCFQNRDGLAVYDVAGKFKGNRGRKLLIVISDGMPEAQGYSGEPAVTDSAWLVRKVKEMGVTVLSISITEDARDANDLIYGRENNIFNEDPNVIARIVESLITE